MITRSVSIDAPHLSRADLVARLEISDGSMTAAADAFESGAVIPRGWRPLHASEFDEILGAGPPDQGSTVALIRFVASLDGLKGMYATRLNQPNARLRDMERTAEVDAYFDELAAVSQWRLNGPVHSIG